MKSAFVIFIVLGVSFGYSSGATLKAKWTMDDLEKAIMQINVKKLNAAIEELLPGLQRLSKSVMNEIGDLKLEKEAIEEFSTLTNKTIKEVAIVVRPLIDILREATQHQDERALITASEIVLGSLDRLPEEIDKALKEIQSIYMKVMDEVQEIAKKYPNAKQVYDIVISRQTQLLKLFAPVGLELKPVLDLLLDESSSGFKIISNHLFVLLFTFLVKFL